jgi:hypothetical protein
MQPKYRIKCSNKWNKTKTRQFAMRFSVGKDDEVIAKLDSAPNKTDYVRGLIKSDLEKS